jgi:N-acetylglucosaminyldiphosphoundecaprenol N-acetyl-beta-D-mannosaminyltransferase
MDEIMNEQTSMSDAIRPYAIFDCPCYPVTEANIDEAILSMVERDQAGYAVAINAEKIHRFQEDNVLRQTINNALFPYPDGAGAVLGLKLLHKMSSEKINMPIRALETANKHRLKVFIVGAKPDTHNEAIGIIQQRYPDIELVGNMHGYHDKDDIKQAIIKTGPQLIMLALGSPRQEHFAASLVPELAHGFVIGCGGALDIIAGRLKRAPEFWINNNLEWLYRLIQEPWRWRRQMFLPVFYLRLLKIALKTRLFGKAAS